MDDRELLVGNSTPNGGIGSRVKRTYDNHKKLFWFLVVLSCIVVGHLLAYHFIYGRCNGQDCLRLKVMSLNCWGMPEAFGSVYKTERIKGIATELSKAEYDIYLFEELWMSGDYYTVRAGLPQNYHMTEYRGLSLSTCDGRLAPSFCSGLAIASRFPFKEVEFNSYTEHGDWRKAAIDGEWLARKGVGRVQIEPIENITIDVFVTHTAADPDPSHGYNNSYYRDLQVKELMESYVLKSTADMVILGGDFNAGPDMKDAEAPFATVRKHMINSVEEIYYKVDEWLDSKFATYGNLQNTFSGFVYDPIIYDYIFYMTNTNKTQPYTNWFELPLFKMKIFDTIKPSDKVEEVIPSDGSESTTTTTTEATSLRSKREAKSEPKIISFSDHEAVTSTIYIRY